LRPQISKDFPLWRGHLGIDRSPSSVPNNPCIRRTYDSLVVLHRPVEPARIIGNFAAISPTAHALRAGAQRKASHIEVYHFSPRCKHTRGFLDRFGCVAYTKVLTGVCAGHRGAFVAQTHVSTQSAPPPQNARLPVAHEDRWRTQGPGRAPQEGPPSAHARINLRKAPRRLCPGPGACSAAATSTRFIEAGGGDLLRDS